MKETLLRICFDYQSAENLIKRKTKKGWRLVDPIDLKTALNVGTFFVLQFEREVNDNDL